MGEHEIKHFLVIYDPACREAAVQEFGTDYETARDVYQQAEQRARGTNLDVVLLSADSLDTIKRTHSSYFELRPLDQLLCV
ncbi:MAG TPA: hypothetical protein VFW38_00140 [Solirubrobacteraceae bacterium]|nr:hypothetical protein [Solirubrobacteraceae bacterium]